MAGLARLLVRYMLPDALAGCMRRGVEMERHRACVRVRVGHAVESELVGHVGHVALVQGGFLAHVHGGAVAVRGRLLLGPVIECFHQLALQNLHDTMRVSMVMDQGALAGVPHQNE